MKPAAGPSGNHSGKRSFVKQRVACATKTHCERLHRLVDMLAHERHYETAVDTTREKCTDRNIADQVRTYCVANGAVEPLEPFPLGRVVVCFGEIYFPVASFLDTPN